MPTLPCGREYNPDNNECCMTVCPDKVGEEIDKCYTAYKKTENRTNLDRYGEELINTNRKDRLFAH